MPLRTRTAWSFLIILLLAKPVLSVTKTSDELMLSAEFPEIVNTSEFEFQVVIQNLVNKTRVLEAYSYVYKGSECVSGAWTSNLEMMRFEPYERKEFNMTNELEEVNGIYSIKLRVREGEKNTDLQSYITINQTLKKAGGVTGYSIAVKTAAYAGLSVVGLAALYLVMRRI
jgi:hypothetical protein